ncbi:hypothetical protein D5086_024959 [Populus alba]|uniref:Uncharacterized protein n=1 Tax=Populus alba TaxID=43335 RepID=A0ACC4B7M3_POPAL
MGSGRKPSATRQGFDEREANAKEEVQADEAVFHDHLPIVSSSNDRIRPLLDAVDRKINEKLKASVSELNKIPRRLLSVAEVMAAFMGIIGSSKESLRKILRQVEGMSKLPIEFVEEVWTYIEEVVISVLNHHSESYHQIQLSTRRAGHNLVAKMKEHIRNLVNKEMEKEIVNELLGTGGGVAIEKLFVESPTVASKREKLNTSINLLRESQEVMANIMDEIATAGD